MKLAYTSLACPDWTIEEAVSAARAYGYAAIEWRLADGEIIGPDASLDTRRRLRQVPVDQGIAISCLDSSVQAVRATPAERAAEIEGGRRMLDLAAEIGAPFLRVFGGALPEHIARAALLEPSAEVLHTLANYGSQIGVTVLLETHDAWTRSEDVLALWRAVALPAFKVLWDTHHTYRFGEAPARTLAILGEAIAYAHIKDSRLTGPDTWTYCLAGAGDIPLREIVDVLGQSNFIAYLSLEWEKKWHPEIEEPEIALPQAATYLRAFSE